ncbi:hypothetical protein [Bradyrhizobium sp. Arg816]|uniref:hypothetical protein n=1 Tax=Bradyrhizobium sp. Arg816 TaxID=2998491 RepID=UPI00249F2CF9|nr:hypothetical protein [Bradyrhizobium sp. Arg816]MDI3563553.1 hypothetical protein [Bradyrhizobium sp. Arg816]
MSSPSPSPSPSPAPAAPAAASPPTPTSPDGTAPAASSAPARPDGLPDSFWDAEKNEVKTGDLVKRFNELSTKDAADAVRKNSLPATADAYKIELPKEFTMPAGVEFKFDEKAPELAQARAMAHAKGWTQQDFSEALGIFAAAKISEQATINAARTAEVGKLGATGPQRVDAVTQWMDAQGLGVLKSTMVTAAQVQAWEAHITKLTSQGTASFSQSHRVAPDDNKIPGYETMSFEQRRHAQEQRARRTA